MPLRPLSRTIFAVGLVTLLTAAAGVTGCADAKKDGPQEYRNAPFGYALKYPSTWVLESTGPQATYITLHRKTADTAEASKGRSVTVVTVEVLDSARHLGVKEAYAAKYADGDGLLRKAGAPEKRFEAVTFAGRSAFLVTTPGLANSQRIFDTPSGAVLSVAIEVLGDESDTQHLPEANAIVESFRLE